jgi:CubicO group peptidase (beta-lactamase class C family)
LPGWRYIGYDNSYVDLDGKQVQSVTGGTRWGGGLWISALDQARFGLLFLRQGVWNGKRVVSEDWIKRAVAPSPMKSDYGYLWWLNTGRKAWPALSEKAFAAVGFGSNTIWVDPEKDLVIVWRWHPGGAAMNEFLSRVVGSIVPPSDPDKRARTSRVSGAHPLVFQRHSLETRPVRATSSQLSFF